MPVIAWGLMTLWTIGLGFYTGRNTGEHHRTIVMRVHYRCEENSLTREGLNVENN